MAASPTARTLKWLKREGYLACVVERYNHYTRRRNDLFGIIDVLAIREGETLGVQATSVANQAARINKLRSAAETTIWLAAGNRLQVHGWSKRKVKRGGKAFKWDVTITELRGD